MSEAHLDRMSFVRGTQAGREAGRKGGRQAGRYLAVLIREVLGEEQKKKRKRQTAVAIIRVVYLYNIKRLCKSEVHKTDRPCLTRTSIMRLCE